jgi:hypothetical protein
MLFKSKNRSRKFIDRPIQGALVLRVLVYWIVSALVQVLVVAYMSIVAGSDSVHVHAEEFWWHIKLAAVSSMLILPFLLLDIVRLSHRWVGPIYRLRSGLKSLAQGDTIPPLVFREGDFWQELAADFNAVAKRVRGANGLADTGPMPQRETEA